MDILQIIGKVVGPIAQTLLENIKGIPRRLLTLALATFSLGFSLGFASHATFPAFQKIVETSTTEIIEEIKWQVIETEWLSERERNFTCAAVVNLSNYGKLPCYSIGQLRNDFMRNKNEGVHKYIDGDETLPHKDKVSLGQVYLVGKFRNQGDFITNSPCDNEKKMPAKDLHTW
jgi:hypothetical protein